MQKKSALKGLFLLEQTSVGVGKMYEGKEESETRLHYGSNTSHHSHPPRTFFEEGMEESGMKD